MPDTSACCLIPMIQRSLKRQITVPPVHEDLSLWIQLFSQGIAVIETETDPPLIPAHVVRTREPLIAWCYCASVHEDVLEMGHDAAPSGEAMSTRVGSRIGPTGRFRDHVQRSDLLGVAWVLVSGLAILVPVLLHGWILGPYDLLSRVGLTKAAGVKLHIFQNSDLINSLIPWWDTVWQQVHQGHLPLWNPYGGLGMPLAFNWQSAPFSLPALVGYLTPMRDAFTVGVAVNIVVAGSGAYLLGRVLGMGAMASAAVGTVFELSGPIAAWLGYPFPAVMSWAGWILAIGLLLLRGRHRAGLIVALALTVAFSLYGGAPEGFAVLMLTVCCSSLSCWVSHALAGWLRTYIAAGH